MIVIDFETRSECDLKNCGAAVYAEHPSTEVLCLAYRIAGADTQLWKPGDPVPQSLFAAIADGNVVCAHNAYFEKCIWKYVMIARHQWPGIPELQWRCSASQAAALALPRSLEEAGQAIGLDVQKDADGHRVMLKMCKPRKPTKNNPAKWHEKPAEFQTLYRYCIRDVDAEYELENSIPPLIEREQQTWRLCQRINDRGIPVDLQTVRSALRIVDKLKKQDDERISELTQFAVTAATQRDSLLNWLRKNGVEADDVTKNTVETLLDRPDLKGTVVEEVLRIRQEQSKTSTAKFKAMLFGSNADGRMRDTMMFHGASTGRWSGRRIQPQNLPREHVETELIETLITAIRTESPSLLEMVFGDPMKMLSAAVRNCICAPDRKKLIVCDFAAIEARVLAWLADEEWKLDAFRKFDAGEGDDMYVVAANRIAPGTSRQIGKVAELAMGYQGGVKAFQSMAVNYSLELSDEVADQIKVAWRKAHPQIVQFWYDLERAAIAAVQHQEKQQVGRVTFYGSKGFLFCRLPCGRSLAYYEPKIAEVKTQFGRKTQLTFMGVDGYTRKWKRQSTYGGKLAENITQAVARDFLVESLFRVEQADYPVIFHVHDELACEVDEEFGSIGEVKQLMEIVPQWGKGCPIAAEGFEGRRYRK